MHDFLRWTVLFKWGCSRGQDIYRYMHHVILINTIIRCLQGCRCPTHACKCKIARKQTRARRTRRAKACQGGLLRVLSGSQRVSGSSGISGSPFETCLRPAWGQTCSWNVQNYQKYSKIFQNFQKCSKNIQKLQISMGKLCFFFISSLKRVSNGLQAAFKRPSSGLQAAFKRVGVSRCRSQNIVFFHQIWLFKRLSSA